LTELALSTGSACNSATGEPSYVLRALGRTSALAQSTLRFSLGRGTDEADVDVALRVVGREIRRLRAASPSHFSAMIVPEARFSREDMPQVELDPLSPCARRLFETLPGLGALDDGPGVVRGEAGGPSAETWIRFHLRVTDGIVRDARFQAFGCPHTLAVMAWLTMQLIGRTLAQLVVGEPGAWARELCVPVEKLGRLLVVEDALRACVKHGL